MKHDHMIIYPEQYDILGVSSTVHSPAAVQLRPFFS